MRYPKTMIIILNWNGYPDTAECLESLKKIDYPNYEIIVVDNGSRDGSPKKLKEEFPHITLIENLENLGFAKGNNIGMKYALKKGTDYVLLLNNDTIVDSNFLSELIKIAESNPKSGAVAPKIYYYDHPEEIWFAGGSFNRILEQPYHFTRDLIDKHGNQVMRECDYLTGCAILIKRDILEEVGLFDPDYFIIFEETDWCFRVKKHGYSLLYVPTSKIWHKVSRAAGGFNSPLNVYYFTRNQLLFLRKNKKIPFLLYPKNILKFFRFAISALFKPSEGPKAISVIRGMLDFHFNKFGRRFSKLQ